MRHNVIVYDYADRPDVEVLVDDTWCPGTVRMRWQEDDGTWWANIQWTPTGTTNHHLDNFPADQVRLDDVNRRRPAT